MKVIVLEPGRSLKHGSLEKTDLIRRLVESSLVVIEAGITNGNPWTKAYCISVQIINDVLKQFKNCKDVEAHECLPDERRVLIHLPVEVVAEAINKAA